MKQLIILACSILIRFSKWYFKQRYNQLGLKNNAKEARFFGIVEEQKGKYKEIEDRAERLQNKLSKHDIGVLGIAKDSLTEKVKTLANYVV